MDQTIEVSPSYGREYKSAAAVKADWEAGKDFTIQTFGSDMGRQINKQDAERSGISTVMIRYARMTKVVVVKVARRNPSHRDCGGVGPRHQHYQGKCHTDWNWGVGASSREARKTFPSLSLYAIVKPGGLAGTWTWQVRDTAAEGIAVGGGTAGSSNAAKAAVSGYVKSLRRSNPASKWGRIQVEKVSSREMIQTGPKGGIQWRLQNMLDDGWMWMGTFHATNGDMISDFGGFSERKDALEYGTRLVTYGKQGTFTEYRPKRKGTRIPWTRELYGDKRPSPYTPQSKRSRRNPGGSSRKSSEIPRMDRRGWVAYPIRLTKKGRFHEDLHLIRNLVGSNLYEIKTEGRRAWIRRVDD